MSAPATGPSTGPFVEPLAAPLAHVLDLLLDAICVVDPEGRFVFVSAAFERIFGYQPAEVIGRRMIELVHPDDRALTLATVDEIVAGQPKPMFENRYLRKDGRVVHIMWSARWSEADQVRVAVARDVTERKRAEAMQAALYAISEAAHAAEDLLALFRRIHQIVGGLLPAVNFFVALHDAASDSLSFPYYVDQHDDEPPPTRAMDSGTLSAEVIRSGRALLLTPDDRASVPAHVRLDVGRGSLDWLGVPLATQARTIGALVVQSYSGDVRYTDRDAELLQFVSTQVATAIERKQLEARLQHIARHDPLTELPNRALFADRVQVALARARRDQARFALLYLDLDRFKLVNDTHGHAVGDQLLQAVAMRLRQCVRGADTVARVGGDEFVVLLGSVAQPDHTCIVAGKIVAALAAPFDLAGHRLEVAPSIGIALFPDHGSDFEALLRAADGAMYEAKRGGGSAFSLALLPG